MGQSDFVKNVDIEGQLYPTMTEDPQMRWAFIRKVYAIISIQMLITIAVAAAVVFFLPSPQNFLATTSGKVTYIVILILPFIVMIPMYIFQKRHPVNIVLLVLFTISIALMVGLGCSTRKGKAILEAGILATVVVVSLTLYTFWAAKRGRDFQFLGPFLFASLMVLLVFGIIQIFIPMGKIGVMIYGCVGSIIFSGYIVYDTDELIKRHTYDEYVAASVALYLDIINLFLSLLRIFSALND